MNENDHLCLASLSVIRILLQLCIELTGLDTHVKTHGLLQVSKQVVTHLFTSCRQVVFASFVPSCCNKFVVTSC
jgi:hypothetical protein